MRRRRRKKNYNILIFVACFGFSKNLYIYKNLFLDCFSLLFCSVLFFFCFIIIIIIILVMRFLVDWNVISNRKLREIDEREKSKNKKLLLHYDYIIALYIYIIFVISRKMNEREKMYKNLILSETKKLYWITWSFFFTKISID